MAVGGGGVIKKLHPELQQVRELQLAEAAIRVGLLKGFVMILTSIYTAPMIEEIAVDLMSI